MSVQGKVPKGTSSLVDQLFSDMIPFERRQLHSDADFDVGEFRSPTLIGQLEPASVEEVRAIVARVASVQPSLTLHPVSTGRNWGLGSRKSPDINVILMELRRLDAVREVDTEHGFAVVEPGVTQGDLSKLLKGTDRYLNVTASAAATSILGNALDRGVGLRGQRTEDLMGLEVVLPDSSLHRLGWWPGEQPHSALYRYHVGPSMVQAFCQSSFGIVTAGVFKLNRRASATRVVTITFQTRFRSQAIDMLRQWYDDGIIRGVLKIYDNRASDIYGSNGDLCRAYFPIDGAPDYVFSLSNILRERVAREEFIERVVFSDDSDDPYGDDLLSRVVRRGFNGDVSAHDALVEQTLGSSSLLADREGDGWLMFLPLIPFSSKAVMEAFKLISEVQTKRSVSFGATINALNADVIDLVIILKFKRNKEQSLVAHGAISELRRSFLARGFIPYRSDIGEPRSKKRSGRDLTSIVKNALDPKGIIARGRYT